MLLNIFICIGLSIYLFGCGRDEQLYELGTFSFTVFLFMLASLFAIKYVHKNNYLLIILGRFTPAVLLFSKCLRAVAILIMVRGSLLVFDSENTPEKLTFFLGVVIYIMGHFLGRWVTEPIERKAENWRYVSLSFGFTVVITYIISGAPGLK